MTTSSAHKTHFIKKIIDQDHADNPDQTLVTRFPPEPNGYLHIGHAKSICVNFGLAKQYGGICHLRFDDTNPSKEEQRYIDAIIKDVEWLGFDWNDHLYHTSDYFEQLYQFACELIDKDLAYVDDLSPEQMREYRGTLTEPGQASPSRTRPVAESRALFERMRRGEFQAGEYTLRAKIDMSAGNINLRDPILYRILHDAHPRTGTEWCIYPMYDFAHALSDAIEGITHSLCTLEFQDNRALYDWCVANVSVASQPKQIEFSRLNVNYTLTSKRKLKQLVDANTVSGWDDPRMPTLSGLRHRGYPAAAIREFCQQVGVSKQDSIIDLSQLEACVRDSLNQTASRRMAVIRPIKVVLTNFTDDQTHTIRIANHPQDPSQGDREVTFSRELYIDADDFQLDPPSGFFRLKPQGKVRLAQAYVIECQSVIQDPQGHVTELHCTYDPDTFGGKKPADGKKVKGIIHWVSAQDAVNATVRLYDRLFQSEHPGANDNLLSDLNPDSLTVITDAKIEPSLAHAQAGETFQFNRVGYFCVDPSSQPDAPVFNRTVTLRDAWKK